MSRFCYVNTQEPIIEYREENEHTVINEKGYVYIKPDKDYWLFPGIPRLVRIDLELWIPSTCVGLLVKSEHLGPNIQIDTKVMYDTEIIHSSNYIPFLHVTNRGLLPKKLKSETIIAKLVFSSAKECHILKIEG